MMNKPVVLIGMGGHARVLLEALYCSSVTVSGYVNPTKIDSPDHAIEYLGDDDDFIVNSSPSNVLLVNGMGGVKSTTKRENIYKRYKKAGYHFATVIHPHSIIAQDVVIGEGCQVMAGVVIQLGSRFGENIIINTRAGIDHDCVIGSHAHISINSTLAGSVHVGERVYVGASATVIQGVKIGLGSVVGAGAVVISDVDSGDTVVGVPALRLNR